MKINYQDDSGRLEIGRLVQMETDALQIDDFVKRMAALKFDHVFNPYADSCDQHDKSDAPAIRRR